MEIRPASPGDAAMLHNLILAAFAEYEGVLVVRPQALGETLEEVEQAIKEGGVLLAWDGDEALGSVRYELRPDSMYVGRLAVAPAHRSRGIGAVLMRYIEQLAPTMGRSRIELATRQSMPGNLAFYRRIGYRVARREAHTRGPDTVVWFEKELTE